MKRPLILAVVLGLLAIPRPLTACTTFCFVDTGQVVFGKNYDWSVDEGHLIVNKRGVARSALGSTEAEHGARWRSRYGSVTFNQYGRDFPSGGMNEKGLIVELMCSTGRSTPRLMTAPRSASWSGFNIRWTCLQRWARSSEATL